MASTLRYDRSCSGILPVAACRSLGLQINEDGSPGPKWPASDVLLVAVASRRSTGQRRFSVEQSADDGSYYVEANEKRQTQGEPDDNLDAPKTQARSRPARGGGRPAASTRQGDGRRQRHEVITKTKRGGRGNPNRPSQLARTARLEAEAAADQEAVPDAR